MLTFKKLKALVKTLDEAGIPDSTLIMRSAADHGYRHCYTIAHVEAIQDDSGDYSEPSGDEECDSQDGNELVKIIVVN